MTIDNLLNEIKMANSTIPDELITYAKEYYKNDQRPIETIKDELNILLKRYYYMEELISKPINSEILKNSIILIGPMGTGKTTVAKLLQQKNGMPKISLDDKQMLNALYQNREKFSNFKDFEFYLTSSVLTNLQEPTIIDFGAGHSVYENPLMFYEMKKLMSQFANVTYLIPSQDKEESFKILNERIAKNRNVDEHVMQNNKHFIYSNCNENLATNIIYTNNKNWDEIIDEITFHQKTDSNNNEFHL
jgi:shikimate kinase